jgi:transcriptional regulator with XRE-family HTH domain
MARTARSKDAEERGKRLMAALGERRTSPPERSQAELARAADIPLDTLRKLERKPPADPGFFLIARLARELGASLDGLVDEILGRRS